MFALLSYKYEVLCATAEVKIPVVNAGGWFGRAWLISVGPFGNQFVVEADTESDAIDELVDSSFGQIIKLEETPEILQNENTHFAGNNGVPVDLSEVQITRARVLYFSEEKDEIQLPKAGASPKGFDSFQNIGFTDRGHLEKKEASLTFLRESDKPLTVDMITETLRIFEAGYDSGHETGYIEGRIAGGC